MFTVGSIYDSCSLNACNVLLLHPKDHENGTYLSNFGADKYLLVLSLPVSKISVWDDDLVLYCDDWYPWMGYFPTVGE